jgi:3-polyprenyl-4-hydroxybenzoate decarboxylase
MRKAFEGEARNVILGAFAGHYDVKHVVDPAAALDPRPAAQWRDVLGRPAPRTQ